MPGPQWETSGTNLDGTTTSAPVFPAPSGVADKDLVIIAFYADGATVTVTTPPSGFQAAPDTPGINAGPAGNHQLHVWWKRSNGSEPGSYTFTLSASVFVEGRAHRYSGARSTGDPWDVTAYAEVENTEVTSVSVSDTTTVDNTLLINVSTDWSGGGWTPSSGFTERQDGSIGLVQLSDKAQATAGATGTVAAVCVNADKSSAWLGALAPDVVATPGYQPALPPWLLQEILGAAALQYQTSAAASTPTANESGTSAIGLSGHATAVKVALQSGRATIGLSGQGVAAKVAVQSSRGILGLTGYGPTQGVRAQSGRGVIGLSGYGVALHRALAAGVGAVGLSGRGTAAKNAPQTGTSVIGLSGRGTVVKTAVETGIGCVGLSGRGNAAKKALESGAGSLGLSGQGTASKKAPQSGRGLLGLSGQGPTKSGFKTDRFMPFFM